MGTIVIYIAIVASLICASAFTNLAHKYKEHRDYQKRVWVKKP